jgi:hypothetical protein
MTEKYFTMKMGTARSPKAQVLIYQTMERHVHEFNDLQLYIRPESLTFVDYDLDVEMKD